MNFVPENLSGIARLGLEAGEISWDETALGELLLVSWPAILALLGLVGWGLVDMLLPDDIHRKK